MSYTTVEERRKADRRKAMLPSDVLTVRRCSGCGGVMFLKPLIQYGNSGCTLPLRCFSYRSGDWFFAQCLDLNLMSRGHTEEEAVSRLQEQMFSYVATAFDGDLKGLVPRKASAPNWLRYYWHLLKQKIHHRGRQHSTGELRDVGTKILSHC